MTQPKDRGRRTALWPKTARLCLWIVALGTSGMSQARAATNVVLWDTIAPFAGASSIDNKRGWKAVPSDLLTLETDPSKASSDPGYYGREYGFQGDPVVQNRTVAAAFLLAEGKVVLYAKSAAPNATTDASVGKPVLEFLPFRSQAATISRCEIARNAGDQVALDITFSAKGSVHARAIFAFDKSGIVQVTPAENMNAVRLASSVAVGIVPSFIGDDLILEPSMERAARPLAIPAENIFVALLQGEEAQVVMTWAHGKQQLTLSRNGSPPEDLFDGIDFDPDGQSFYLGIVAAPGIWHREKLTSSFLEKDVAIRWKRPFSARWETQLYEEGVKTTFAFRETKGQIWRGVPGSYSYPVWFDGDQAVYHLSKKVPPKGQSIIYFLEGKDTPDWAATPVEILKATLGRAFADSLLDVHGRKLRTHHRRGADGVRRACTCGCTEVIQAIFEAGEEVARKEEVKEALDDMIFFVQRHVQRIDEYRRFADEMGKFLRAQAGASPDLKLFLDTLGVMADQIPQEYEVQKNNMKSLAYAEELFRQTMALTARNDPNNLKKYMELSKAWRAMGGAQDYVLAQCHTLTRKFSQTVGYAGVQDSRTAALARDIRQRCKQCLRNPDGYEIWADY